jgi:hypothetical protein
MKPLPKKIFFTCLLLIAVLLFPLCRPPVNEKAILAVYKDSRPWTRWWWFASVITPADIRSNLDWLKANHFGGVEVAWIYPLNRMKHDTINTTPRQPWLSDGWTQMVVYTKKYADSLGLGCDFTFGTLWPFGDSKVDWNDGVYLFGRPLFRQKIEASWEYPVDGLVINHLDSDAFYRYASRMDKALRPAMEGSRSGLFVDSWEVETKGLWTPGFDSAFRQTYNYDITPWMNRIYETANGDQRYDYMNLLSHFVIQNFYLPFHNNARAMGGFSRAQCMGAPVDILTAYGIVDVPESEAMLYEPPYSRIPASAALLSSKKIVTSETFTCLYGWPRDYHSSEQVADLKIVADALFANGVNQIIWHGKPFNPAGTDSVKFYASVHVGPSGSLGPDIRPFNDYLQKISRYLKNGKTYSDIAVYLPLEDAWYDGVYPDSLQMPWAWGAYELRYVHTPQVLKGYQPLWVNAKFLSQGKLINRELHIGDAVFSGLYIDVKHLDLEALRIIMHHARNSFAVFLAHDPMQAGRNKTNEFNILLDSLKSCPSVTHDLGKMIKHKPLVEGDHIPDFWCRTDGENYWLFFSSPRSQNLHLPIGYGESFSNDTLEIDVAINAGTKHIPVRLTFRPYQSVLVKVDVHGKISLPEIDYLPPIPTVMEGKGRGF